MAGTAQGISDPGAAPVLGRRDRVVLAALALSRPSAVSQDQLAEALWPQGPPASSAKVVHGCISRLRARLGTDTITTLGTGYVLSRRAVTDADRFEQGVIRGRDLLGLGQADRAAFVLDERLRDWKGPPYAELDDWPPAAAENTRLVQLKLHAEELLVDALLESGDVSRAAVQARAFAEREPLRERRWAQLALAEYRLGEQAAALEALRSCRAHLAEELGIDPSPEVAELEIAVLRQDPVLAAPPVVPRSAAAEEVCPWPGLSAYGPDDAESFFGRDDDIVAALAMLDARGCLAVVGPSGIGKSSIVRAGVIPALRARDCSVQLITPGAHALAHGGDPALEAGLDVLVVDQAEELFTLPDAQRAALLEALDEHVGQRVIVMRADQMAGVASLPVLARFVEQGLFLLGGLSEAGLTAAIEQPAAQHGLLVEPGLAELLLRDIAGEPAALPLFSHALAQTWSRREGRTLTVAGYRETGGVRGAVAQSAERVYADTDIADRKALRSLMLRLVTPGSEGEPRRARVPADQVAYIGHTGLVDALVRARLITRDADTFTLTHEALVDGWPRLREWLDEDVEGRRVFHHLAAAARAWDELGRPDSELYRGVRLARAQAWAETDDLALSETESAFLAAGQRLADAEAAALADQVRRQRRTNRALRSLLAGLVVLLSAALVAGVVAVGQARRADRQSLDAIASAVGAKALKTDDPQLSLLLAAAAEQVSPTADTLRSLSSAVASRPLLARTVSIPGSDHLGGVATTSDRVFTMDRLGVVKSFDTQLRLVGSYDSGDGHPPTLGPPLAAGDDVVVVGATPGDPRPIRVLDPETLAELPTQLRRTPKNVYVIAVALSADGRRVSVVYSPATAGHPVELDVGNRIRVWDLITGLPAGPPIQVEGRWTGTALSADGSTVFSSTPVAAYDVATGKTRWTTDVFTWNNAMDVSGDMVATGTQEFQGEWPAVQVFDARTGEHEVTLPGDLGSIQTIVFSRDGKSIAGTGVNGTAVVWDTKTGEPMQTLETGGPPINGAAFSADGKTLYLTKPLRQQLQAWSLDGSDTFIPRIGFDQIPRYARAVPRLSSDGTRLALGGWTDNDLNDVSLTLVDLDTEAVRDVPVVGKHHPLQAGAWSPAGDRYAAGYDGGWVQVIDADSGVEAIRRRVSDLEVVALSYAGSNRLVVATEDKRVLLLDARTLDPLGTATTLPEDVGDVAGFSDGRTAMVLGAGTEAKVTRVEVGRTWYRVDLLSGKVVQRGRLTMRQALVLALAPDERHAAVGGTDGQVEIVDLASGRSIRPAVSDGAGEMLYLAFDARGDRLATASNGRPLGLWDVRTGTPLAASGLVEDLPTLAVAFAADGRVIVASYAMPDGPRSRNRGEVYAWDVSAAAAVRYACKIAGRDLTRQEWADAFGDVPYRRICSGR